MKNLYTDLEALKGRLGLTATTWDALLLTLAEAASRRVDEICGRHFYVETATRYIDGRGGSSVRVADLLSVTTLKTDENSDRTYEVSWTEGTDFELTPDNLWPKLGLRALPLGNYSFPWAEKSIEIAGSWGFGDGESASPWTAAGGTGTVADATGTTLTLSAAGLAAAGQTILIGTEQMLVSAVSGTAATVARGVNGTTAAAHSGAAIQAARYPATIAQATLEITSDLFNERGRSKLLQERIDDYSYMRFQDPATADRIWVQVLGPYRRPAA